MRVGAYQFSVTKDINANFQKIKDAVVMAKERQIRLIVFPECALTGYPPRDIGSPAEINFERLDAIYNELQENSNRLGLHIIVGTITRENSVYYNTAMIFSPFQEKQTYHKRALWGWDRDNFAVGNNEGVIQIDDWKIGIRICYEIRFPEFFRELYVRQTDLNIVLFYDVSDYDDISRCQMIKSHILTRAVENVTYTLTVNAVSPFQTAPTILCDKSGQVLQELARNEEKLLMYCLEKAENNFGETGRKEIADWLCRMKFTD
ncbi:MAG: carbon-nitrogen hydrolase family protein [Roseburia sp.]|nr:carbon-nitrogen hydrolase family protein [Roseburia sp.]MCM1099455.1 carbon-nitrogen hydrolase family protein [Ruminococcus flavefaciens]